MHFFMTRLSALRFYEMEMCVLGFGLIEMQATCLEPGCRYGGWCEDLALWFQ
jgi:hypothetical protein